MILIADAGSTKTEWLALEGGRQIARIEGEGLNIMLCGKEEAALKVSRAVGLLSCDGACGPFDSIWFYGAGCATEEVRREMTEILSIYIDAGEIHVDSDLLGAARGLLSDGRGIACILGTGSNSCLYDGRRIVRNIPSLGYILGDEGSGVALGKRLVSDTFKGHLPLVMRQAFESEFSLTPAMVLEEVYRGKTPNKFLASLVPFLKDHLWNPYIYSLVLDEFKNFFKRNVALYQGARSIPVSFTGSIAFHFEDVLRKAADVGGYNIGRITRNPLDGLALYHSRESV